MSDTPIFDQLARERGYSRLITGGLKPALPARKQTDDAVNAAPKVEVEKDLVMVPNFWKISDEE